MQWVALLRFLFCLPSSFCQKLIRDTCSFFEPTAGHIQRAWMQPRTRFTLELPSRGLVLGKKTLIMGILNVTPDSFYDGGRYFKFRDAVSRGLQLEDDGADIVDVGGESTRPPFLRVLPVAEEIRRVAPVVEALRKRLSIPLSVDTFKAEVARSAISAGAEIVNDIGGLRLDSKMSQLIASSRVGLVLMHSRGKPGSMHQMPAVRRILRVVRESLERSISKAGSAGIRKNQLIIDPGLGFSKTAENNLELLKRLPMLSRLRLPILVGASRKSFVGKVLGLPIRERLLGSLASSAIAIVAGAHIVRVHDVRETVQVVRICDAVRQSSSRNR
jgi:dihydropteroate synthase